MKKKLLLLSVLVISTNVFAEENVTHIYGKLGLDYSKFINIKTDNGKTLKGNKGSGMSGFVEITKDITTNLELGMGIGYIHHSREKAKNNSGVKKWRPPKYDTIPLYAVGKYNFDSFGELKPYIKTDLGIAFNQSGSSFEIEIDNPRVPNNDKISAKNGVYAGIGFGAEYNNVLMELSYHLTTSKIKGKDENDKFEGNYANRAITLAVGYKFDF
ncbi:MAG: outer membrane beta-barrel protein [Fusobacterium necrophorum]|nr:outer membrane beta-barrel protein [Fusobacterium necrophorum]